MIKASKDYHEVRAAAQAEADQLGFDYGLEFNKLFKTFNAFMLPKRENRYGHELLCEVVYSNNPKPGHGYPSRERGIC